MPYALQIRSLPLRLAVSFPGMEVIPNDEGYPGQMRTKRSNDRIIISRLMLTLFEGGSLCLKQ